jgi:dTDP-4-dehydrorhamnose 3,5-epimerase
MKPCSNKQNTEEVNLKQISFFKNEKKFDTRGFFLKILDSEAIENFTIRDIFLSESKKGTIRGMHLQTGRCATDRIIVVLEGAILDVAVDLRAGEEFGKETFLKIDAKKNPGMLFVPKGYAHGFQVLSKKAKVLYITNSKHCKKHDAGFNPRSITKAWPVEKIIMSDRDNKLPTLTSRLKIH